MYRNESKNFFYDITISTPDGKKSARLTDTLLKQCTKVDIVETVASEESGQGASSLQLSFIEADFLPDSLNKTPIEGIAGRGYTTNRTGALLDIRFDSEKGFTYVTPEELESGYTESSRTQSGDSELVKFLFSRNNIVEITWGYLEPKTFKSRRFKIGMVNYSTGASGNTLNLDCYTLQKDLQRAKLNEGKAMVTKQGDPLTLKQTLLGLARVFGARLVFDEEEVTVQSIEAETPPTEYKLNRTERGGDTLVSTNNNPLYIMRSQSLDYFIKDLARGFNSEYEIYEDPLAEGVPVIRFTAKKLRYEKVVDTLNYRDPNGTMLEFQFNTIAGEANKESVVSAIDEDGTSESAYRDVKLTDGRDSEVPAKTFDPIPLVYNENARNILQRELYGSSTTVPSTSESSVRSPAEIAAYQNSFMGFITVKMVGHPDFQPDVYKIEGVGVRASTTYRFFQVQHSLSASGYTCTMQGKTQENVEQGVENSEQLKGNSEYIKPRLTDGRLN